MPDGTVLHDCHSAASALGSIGAGAYSATAASGVFGSVHVPNEELGCFTSCDDDYLHSWAACAPKSNGEALCRRSSVMTTNSTLCVFPRRHADGSVMTGCVFGEDARGRGAG